MDENELNRLTRLGAVVPLPSGQPGVRVSIEYLDDLVTLPRPARAALLRDRFGDAARVVAQAGGHVDLDTIAVSGQVVEAVLPVPSFDTLSTTLERGPIRIRPLFDRKIV